MQQQRLADKVAVVTGAGRGIGEAIARAYALEGASVVCAARSADQIESVAQAIEAAGGRALAVATDVTDHAAVRRMYEAAVEAFGGLDIVVVNAGGNIDRSRVDVGEVEPWVATIELNLIGAYYCLKEAIPHLRVRGGGKIITVGSGMGHRGSAGNSSYCAAKAGLWMLTRVLAQELIEDGIAVNELVPGPVRTELTRNVEELSKQSGNPTPFLSPTEWVKQPADVVPLALFLATQPAKGPTAQTFSLMRREC